MTTPVFHPSLPAVDWARHGAKPADREGRREPERETGALAARARSTPQPVEWLLLDKRRPRPAHLLVPAAATAPTDPRGRTQKNLHTGTDRKSVV